ncbi:hypothetical protein AB0N89_18130 [Amycolatopsis sp. NPDC089917]|uniref:hypothetical protein n=1 Tax=Amycolatopsis sp. NPDC089917 TaxID=3155187 RepID=UPI00342F8C3B
MVIRARLVADRDLRSLVVTPVSWCGMLAVTKGFLVQEAEGGGPVVGRVRGVIVLMAAALLVYLVMPDTPALPLDSPDDIPARLRMLFSELRDAAGR